MAAKLVAKGDRPRAHPGEAMNDPRADLEKAVMRYLTHLNSDIPLDAEFQLLKASVITAACIFVKAGRDRKSVV